jgi:hypothetical protein
MAGFFSEKIARETVSENLLFLKHLLFQLGILQYGIYYKDTNLANL